MANEENAIVNQAPIVSQKTKVEDFPKNKFEKGDTTPIYSNSSGNGVQPKIAKVNIPTITDVKDIAKEYSGQGGSGCECEESTFIVYADGYMATSTLPSIQVPKLTSEQVSQCITSMSQGKVVVISVENDGVFAVAEVDFANETIKIPYVNYFVTYEVNGNNAIAEYINVSASNKVVTTDNFGALFDARIQELGNAESESY